MNIVINVKQLGKAYPIYSSSWSRLLEWILPWREPRHKLHWILRDLNFSVSAGEVLGIIGVNGAGKSTLLKMVSGIARPTVGSVTISGSVAALLELGIGFHTEFTGRQNVYLAAQLLGLSSSEIDLLMPKILEFAEIGEYIDQPVRVYSSGMQMRLAFSVATAKRPDVLIVDEALSVGDTYFQHKSFSRIRQFQAEGTALLIVSHDKSVIQSICNKAILLNGGTVVADGDPEYVMNCYSAMISGIEASKIATKSISDGRVQTISGNGDAVISKVELRDDSGLTVDVLRVGQAVVLYVEIIAKKFIPRLVFGYGIKDRIGMVVFGTNTALKKKELKDVLPGDKYCIKVEFPANLGIGSYSIQLGLHGSDTHIESNYEWRDLALVFNVINSEHDGFEGCAWIDPKISISKEL